MRYWRPLGLLAALALVACIAISSLRDGSATARGWLGAFVLVSMIPVGSLTLLLLNGISGGRWGSDLEPVLETSARAIPLLFLAFVPVIIFRPMIYHWDRLELSSDVLQRYLNPAFFDARTLIALTYWSVLAWTGAWKRPLFAGLGLVGQLAIATFVPPDWVLTLEPGSTSAGFGMGFGIEQVFAALAFAALVGRQQSERPTRDLAGMLVSALLGTVYFVFMQFLITWYGNIPDKVRWYWAKEAMWPLALSAFLVGAAVPFLSVLNPRVRRDPNVLRIVGAFVLAGVFLHILWLTSLSAATIAVVPFAIATGLLAILLLLASTIVAHGGGSESHA